MKIGKYAWLRREPESNITFYLRLRKHPRLMNLICAGLKGIAVSYHEYIRKELNKFDIYENR